MIYFHSLFQELLPLLLLHLVLVVVQYIIVILDAVEVNQA